MSLQAGTTLGHYEILAAIGAGGMGEVYRALDRKLGREVAIKVLPEELSHDPERLQRFEREAKLLAALNHPSIATLHGLESAETKPFLVMELVEGETLAERIADGPLPLDEAIPIFRQIAEGLEAAHEKGIIHRDLKPANIKLKPDGTVKILDFGLAKAFIGGDVEDASRSPTLTKGTALGAIMGTPSYMSPEQARGLSIDKRTDIWAFGCVLYEALAGKKAFPGDTFTDILARIVEGTPELDALPEKLPRRIRRLLGRCLEKDRRRRLRDIGEAWYALTAEEEDPQPIVHAPDGGQRNSFLRYVLVGAVSALVGLLARPALTPSTPLTAPLPARYKIAVDRPIADVADVAFALSPRGDQIVYTGASGDGTPRLYLRTLSSAGEKELPGTEWAQSPFFSPDGEWVGFYARGSIQRISAKGGSPALICESQSLYGASWGPADDIVFVSAQNQILTVPANGGSPKPIIRSDESRFRFPSHLPNGKTLLIQNRGGLAVVSLETGAQKEIPIGLRAFVPRYSPTGHIVFVSGNALFAAPFDEKAGDLMGDPLPVIEGVRNVSGVANFRLARNGALYYLAGRDSSTSEKSLVWMDRTGAIEEVTTLRRAFFMPRLSPKGDAIAVTVSEGARRDVWIYEFETRTFRRLTTGGASYGPVWSPSADRIAYSWRPSADARKEIRVIPTDASRPPEVLVETKGQAEAEAWTPDGRALLFSEYRATTDYDIFSIELGSPSGPELILGSEAFETNAALSPDGAWVAFVSDRAGDNEVFLQPFPGLGPSWQISQGGGNEPLWLRSEEIIYRNGNRLMSVHVQTSPSLTIGRPTMLLNPEIPLNFAGYRNYDVTPDGQRFLMPQGEDSTMPRDLAVIVNFDEELRRLTPTN